MIRFLIAISILLLATSSGADTLQYATENGAIDGYDPVSYFTDGAAKRGLNPELGRQHHTSSKPSIHFVLSIAGGVHDCNKPHGRNKHDPDENEE